MDRDLVKRRRAADLVFNVMFAGLLTVLVMRFYLKITNNAQVTFGMLHIAHVMWGGLFLMIGLGIGLMFYGKRALIWASLVGGVGWGLFIDEAGKFLTRDNDYWFRPAVIIIYISFVILFLVYRKLEREQKTDTKTLWYELVENLDEVVEDSLGEREKQELLRLIGKLKTRELDGDKQRMLDQIELVVNKSKTIKRKTNFSLQRLIASGLRVSYNRLFRKKVVFYGLVAYSAWYVVDKFVDVTRILTNPHKLMVVEKYYANYDFFSKTDVYMISFKIVIDLVVASFFLWGLISWINKKTLRGVKFYQMGLLINIFLSSVFKFYFEQFSGVFSLVLSLVLWGWLNNYKQERIALTKTHKAA